MAGRIQVDIQKQLFDRKRHFQLNVQFESNNAFVVLFGASGAGKSVTLQSIAGIVTPDIGKIIIENKILLDTTQKINLSTQQRHIGYFPQNYALFPHLTVFENIAFSLTHWWSWRINKIDKQKIAEIMRLFEITHLADSFPRDLSGGQQQRVALARALICEPHLLLLDEPFAALNPLLRKKMRQELLRIQSCFNIPVLIITHDQEDVNIFGETLVIIDNGQVQHICEFKMLLAENPTLTLDLEKFVPSLTF